MGAAGFEPAYTEVEGFTVGSSSTHWRKQEYIGAKQSMVYQSIDCAGMRHFAPVFCGLVRKNCVKNQKKTGDLL